MDAPVTDRTLRRYLAGAMDPGRREEIEAALAASPRLRERLALLAATTLRDEPSAWRLPPPSARGLHRLTPDVQAAAAMGEDGFQDDDYVEIRFQAPEELSDHRLALLERGADGDWSVLYPQSDQEDRPLSAFPREPDGRVRVDVALSGPGLSRLAIALIPTDIDIDWSVAPARRWLALQEALREGRVPVETAAPSIRRLDPLLP